MLKFCVTKFVEDETKKGWPPYMKENKTTFKLGKGRLPTLSHLHMTSLIHKHDKLDIYNQKLEDKRQHMYDVTQNKDNST